MADVALRSVTKEFPGGTLALDDLSLDIPDGEFLILVGPCARPRAEGVPAGRAAVQPGREAAGADARRAQAAAPEAGHHHRLRDARSGRGDDAGGPHRGDVGGPGAADRPAAARVLPAGQ